MIDYKENENGQVTLSTCTCLDFQYSCQLCKHIFLVNSIKGIPYHAYTLVQNRIQEQPLPLSSLPLLSPLPPSSSYEARLLDLRDAFLREHNRTSRLYMQSYKRLDCNQTEQMIAMLKQTSSLFEKMANAHKGPEKQK